MLECNITIKYGEKPFENLNIPILIVDFEYAI